jgi:peptidoglycan/LPS O-acetylase OafA/YrhL
VRRSTPLIVIATLLVTTAWSAAPIIDDFDIGPFESSEFFRLGSYFMSGALLNVLRPWVGRHAIALGVAGLIASLAVRNLMPFDSLLTSLSLAACVIGLGSSGAMAWFARGGDASYGIYVFAWPVQQFVLLMIAPFWLSLAVAFLVTTALGYATWHGFERRLMIWPRRLGPTPRSPSYRRP